MIGPTIAHYQILETDDRRYQRPLRAAVLRTVTITAVLRQRSPRPRPREPRPPQTLSDRAQDARQPRLTGVSNQAQPGPVLP